MKKNVKQLKKYYVCLIYRKLIKNKVITLDSSTVLSSLFQPRLEGWLLWDESGWICWGDSLLLLYFPCTSSCKGPQWPSGGALCKGGRGGGGCKDQQSPVVLLSTGEGGGGAEGGMSGPVWSPVRPTLPARWLHVDRSGHRWAQSQLQVKENSARFVWEKSSKFVVLCGLELWHRLAHGSVCSVCKSPSYYTDSTT